MTTEVMASPVSDIVDPRLASAACHAVDQALVMCNMRAKCVAVSARPSGESGRITGMIGVHGDVSGFITVNMAERVAIKAVEGFLQDSFNEVTSQVVDGAGEITNLIVGGMKTKLFNTPWSISNITVPSVIIGAGYQVAYATNIDFCSLTFEHQDPEAVLAEDRILKVSVSLLRL